MLINLPSRNADSSQSNRKEERQGKQSRRCFKHHVIPIMSSQYELNYLGISADNIQDSFAQTGTF